ncbi:MAG TPA: carboxypeptidase-like regulatory domain-containing protein [Polyangiaceae bacterium]
MKLRSLFRGGAVGALLIPLSACGGNEEKKQPATCTPGLTTECTAGKVCEAVSGGQPACFDPIKVEGKVFDTVTNKGIAGATVVARDANGAAVSGVATTDANGAYSLTVPVTRDAQGNPVVSSATYTLRADAAGYITFPQPPREALPVDMSMPAMGVVKNSATDIGLIPSGTPAASSGAISGKVLGDKPGGTLIVAGGSTAVADKDGNYTLFNVAPGTVTVTAYKQGVNYATTTATVTAGKTTTGIDFNVTGVGGSTVSGSVNIVNPGNGSVTSVILVVEDTAKIEPLPSNAARGEMPPGLRAYPVSNAWSIPGVPDGKYVVLAAFENDFLVRDPDTSIGGTEVVHITVPGAPSIAFKVTGSLDHPSPDNSQFASAPLTFSWDDDSSEKSYKVQLFDALGNEIWNKNIPGVSGSTQASAAYDGAALIPGNLYQFRATSLSGAGVAISRTEDLRGVFLFQ